MHDHYAGNPKRQIVDVNVKRVVPHLIEHRVVLPGTVFGLELVVYGRMRRFGCAKRSRRLIIFNKDIQAVHQDG